MLLKDGEGAKFLYRLSKSARKRRAGVSVITQDVGDLLSSDLGQAVIGTVRGVRVPAKFCSMICSNWRNGSNRIRVTCPP